MPWLNVVDGKSLFLDDAVKASAKSGLNGRRHMVRRVEAGRGATAGSLSHQCFRNRVGLTDTGSPKHTRVMAVNSALAIRMAIAREEMTKIMLIGMSVRCSCY